MLVGSAVGVEAGASGQGGDAAHQTQLFKEGQAAIDGIERKGGEAATEAAVDGLGVRMFVCAGKLPEDLSSLVGELEAGAPTGDCEGLHTAFELG